MKVLLVSDTHGSNYHLEEVLEIEKPDFLCHMGDLEGSEDYVRLIANCPLAMVAGNNDFWTDLKQEVAFDLAGYRIFMTHGHYYSVYSGYDKLKSAGHRNGADIILFGHIHVPVLEKVGDVYIANPGSLSYPRQEKRRPSYMVLDLQRGIEPKFETKYL